MFSRDDSLIMVDSTLKEKTITSMLWNAVQRFGTVLLTFVSNLVLARLLFPEDFGCIGMLSIFIALSKTFIDGGFGAALIQKQNTTQADYSTIFYWNLFVSAFLFAILQIGAPWVAEFYHMPLLKDVLRVMSVVLLINGFSVIQTTILTKLLSFKLIAKVNLFSTFIGVVVSIIAAYMGMGVWSLVVNNLLASLLAAILFWILNPWRPTWEFSLKSFSELFNFGGLMLLSSLLNTLFENIQGLVIGRFYTAKDMGFYSQAKKLDEVPSSSISQIVTQVSFPVFSKIADDLVALKNSVRKNIICTTYLIFPLQVLLIVLAKPIFLLLFGNKWLDSVPYFQVLCVYSMFVSLNAINTNIYKAMGRSKVYFWVQLSKKILGVILLIIGIRFGVMGVTWSVSISGILWWFISASVNKRLLDYGLWDQTKDVFLSFFISVGAGVLFVVFDFFKEWYILAQLFTVFSLYLFLYLSLSFSMKSEPLKIYVGLLKDMYKRKKHYKY